VDTKAIHLRFKSWDCYDTKMVNCYKFSNNDMKHINKGNYKVVKIISTLH
jgi:hypothetical protein